MEPKSILISIGSILKQILIFLLTLLIGFIIFMCIVLPFHTLRAIIGYLGSIFRKDFIELVSTRSSLWTGDLFEKSPEMTITVIIVFAKKISHEILIEDFKKNVLTKYPRLQQHFEFWLGYPFWKWDDEFDINSHLKIHSNTTTINGQTELHHLANTLNRTPFLPKQSQWNGIFVEKYRQDESQSESSAWIFNINHSVADAFGAQCILLSLVGESNPRLPHNDITVELPFAKMDNTFINSIYTLAMEGIKLKDFNELKQFKRIPPSRERDFMYFNSEKTVPFAHILEIQDHYNVSYSSVMGAITARCVEKVFEQEQLKLPDWIHVMFPVSGPKHTKTTTNHQTFMFVNTPLRSVSGVQRLKLIEADLRKQRDAGLPKLYEALVPLVLGAMPIYLIKRLYKVDLSTAMALSVTIDKPVKTQNTDVTEISFISGPLPGDQGIYIFFMKYGQNLKMGMALSRTYTKSKTKIEDVLECIMMEINELRKP